MSIMNASGFNVSTALSCNQTDSLINSSNKNNFTCLQLLVTEFQNYVPTKHYTYK